MTAVVAIRKSEKAAASKTVEANQKAIDLLPLGSGTWSVDGVPGLYVRCRVQSKSFFLQRRVDGHLVKETLGPLTMKRARAAAMDTWSDMKAPAPAGDGAVTLGEAIEQYIKANGLAEKTQQIARYNAERYLSKWKAKTLDQIGHDRAGVRLLQQAITTKHGEATSNQVVRLLSAVYRWHRKVDTDLPESPMVVARIHKIAARDWAYSPDELRAWWSATKEVKGEKVKLGVSTLGTLKKMWWITCLLTGARKGSIEAMQWADIDLNTRVIKFKVAKGDRPYSIPMSDVLAELLTQYQKSPDVPPSKWLFPSPSIEGAHLVDVKNPNEGVGPAHRLRHTYRTTLAELGASPDQARMLMGHSMGGDVSRGYISTPLVIESLRPTTNAITSRYVEILPELAGLKFTVEKN